MKKRNLEPPQLLTVLVPCQIAGMCVGLVAWAATASCSGAPTSPDTLGLPVFFGFSLIGFVSGIVVWTIAFNRFVKDPDVVKNRTERIKRLQHKIRKRIQANDAAQLNKKDFDVRLRQFLGDSKSADPNGEPFESKMPYWQLTSFGNGKMPKPIEVIRTLLLRIRRFVQSNSN